MCHLLSLLRVVATGDGVPHNDCIVPMFSNFREKIESLLDECIIDPRNLSSKNTGFLIR